MTSENFSNKDETSCFENFFHSSRHWQQVVFISGFLVTVSLVLNILALNMISQNREQEQKANVKFQDELQKQDQETFKLDNKISKTIARLRSKFSKNFETFDEDAEDAKTDTEQIKKKLEKAEKRINSLEEILKKEWKRGCPEHGLTNGTLCYVLQAKKVNFTSALESCKSKDAFLARIPNLQVLNEVTKVFSKSPFFVDGRFNKTTEKWLTSDGEEASYLPWKLDRPQSDGDCVYAYRGGYEAWHCNALFEYLCEF